MITEVEVGKKITYRYQTTLDKYFSYLLTNVSHSQNNLQISNYTRELLSIHTFYQYGKFTKYIKVHRTNHLAKKLRNFNHIYNKKYQISKCESEAVI